MSTLSERLKEAMWDTGTTAADLSRATGAKEPSVSKWVNGRTQNLKGKNLVAAAELLNVSEAWLAHGTLPKKRSTSQWAFPAVDQAKVLALDAKDFLRLETAFIAAAAALGLDIAVSVVPESRPKKITRTRTSAA